MKQPLIFKTTWMVLFLTSLFGMNCGVSTTYKNSKAIPPTHQLWDSLLQEQVTSVGAVNYKGFIEEKDRLEAYLSLLSSHPPAATWTRQERLAYWINAYNAFTVQLIVKNYPVASIQDLHPKAYIPLVNSVWHQPFFNIGGQPMTLHAIEHKILRVKFEEPRIHFAIVCASKSCPALLNEAYTAKQLETQLTRQASTFLADSSRNQIGRSIVQLSKIFSWFKGDFTKKQTLIHFLNQYAPIPIEEDASIRYLEYDWSLNEQSL